MSSAKRQSLLVAVVSLVGCHDGNGAASCPASMPTEGSSCSGAPPAGCTYSNAFCHCFGQWACDGVICINATAGGACPPISRGETCRLGGDSLLLCNDGAWVQCGSTTVCFQGGLCCGSGGCSGSNDRCACLADHAVHCVGAATDGGS